jgi:RecA-family ATPase
VASSVAEQQQEYGGHEEAIPDELHAPEAEISVLGAMLMDGRAIDAVAETLSAGDFAGERERVVYASLVEIRKGGSAVDPTTLAEHLRAAGELEAIGGLHYIADLIDAVPTAANVQYHADIVRARACRRRLHERRGELERARRDPGRSLEEILLLAAAVHNADRQLQQATYSNAARVHEPMFDPAAVRFGRFLDTEPAKRRMIVPDFLPLDIVGLLAGMGGAGKSVLLYQLALSIAAGVRFLGMPVDEVGGVLCLFAEDDEEELHRRGRRILEHMETGDEYVDRTAIAERLHVVPLVSESNLLTAGREGEVVRTNLVERLVAAARLIPNLKYIAIDPTSRFRGGRANAEEDTTRFVEVLETVRAETGATVLTAVHVNKSSIREPGEVDQNAVRGSSALVDGVRWSANMSRLRRDFAKEYGVSPDEADRYVRFDLPKSNYTRPWPGMWLRRETGGVLVPTTLERQQTARKEADNDERYRDVLTRLLELLKREGPMTRNRVEKEFAGKAGVLGAGLQTVRAVASRGVADGVLAEAPDPAGRGGKLLIPAGGS